MRTLLQLSLFFLASVALASGRPDWVDHFRSEDMSAKYYVGRGSAGSSDADAVFLATTDARRQAIAQNFGVYVNFRSQSYRSAETLSSTVSAQELSGQVRLTGFEQQDIYFERSGDSVNAWILFRYPKDEIRKEKTRLKNLRRTSGEDPFRITDYGFSGHSGPMGLLEVHSHPEGLKVRIDTHSESLGEELITPLRIGLASGHHIVVIDDPKYRLHQEEIAIFPGETASIDAVMERAFGTIQVRTDPDQATVSIGATTVKSPSPPIQVAAGVPILIQVAHPEAVRPVEEEVTVDRGESQAKNYTLELKPALLSISSVPAMAEVEVDGKSSGLTQTTVEVSARVTHQLRLHKAGFVDVIDTIGPLPGGGARILPSYTLTQVGEETRNLASLTPMPMPTEDPAPALAPVPTVSSEDPDESPLTQRSAWLEFRLGYMGDTISTQANGSSVFGLGLEYQFCSWLGLETGFDFGLRDDLYANGVLNTYKYAFDAGIPISLLWFNENKTRIFIEPRIFYLVTDYSFSQTAGAFATASSAIGQIGTEGDLGVDFFTGRADATPTFLRLSVGAGEPSLGHSDSAPENFLTAYVGFSFGLGGGR